MKANFSLNMKNVACPMNYVRTKFKLEEMQAGEILEVFLDDGEPIASVPKSIEQDGHKVLNKEQLEDGSWQLTIEKLSAVV